MQCSSLLSLKLAAGQSKTVCGVQGELSGEIHKIGIVESEEFVAEGSYIKARVPVPLAMRLAPFARDPGQQQISSADLLQ